MNPIRRAAQVHTVVVGGMAGWQMSRTDHGKKATSATPGRARRTSHPRPPASSGFAIGGRPRGLFIRPA